MSSNCCEYSRQVQPLRPRQHHLRWPHAFLIDRCCLTARNMQLAKIPEPFYLLTDDRTALTSESSIRMTIPAIRNTDQVLLL